MTTWTNEVTVQEAKECSYCESGKAKFILTDELFSVIKKLCSEVETEWQALLIGEEREGNVVHLHDYYIPKQSVSSASVTNDECFDVPRINEMGIVAGIHSHGDMGVFFSQIDHDCANTSPIKNNIVVNNKGQFCATRAITLPCGMVKFLDADVVRDVPETPDVEVKDIENISKKTYTPLPFYNSPYYGNYNSNKYTGLLKNKRRKKHAFDMPPNVEVLADE